MNLSKLSIKQKFTLALVVAVIFSSLLVGGISQWAARKVVAERLEQSELPNMLMRIRNQIDTEISVMQAATEQLATDDFILDWVERGFPPEEEAKLVNYLKKIQRQYQLTNASFADRQSARYWNQDGFLRTLQNDAADGWFFGFINSGQALSKSLYTEAGVTKLFVNFQMLDGRGLAGIGRTVDEMVELLNTNKIEQTGFVFLTDNKGMVKLHRDSKLLDKTDLARLYDQQTSNELLSKKSFSLREIDIDGVTTVVASSYIDSADWYVIAQVPRNEVFAVLDSARNQMLFWVLIVALGFALVAFVMAAQLTRPIQDLAKVFADLGKGDANLNVRLEQQASEELNALQQGFNAFVAKIQNTVEQVAETSEALRREASSVSETAQLTLEQGHQQSDRTTQVATAINQMSATVSEVAGSAASAAETADVLESSSVAGQRVVAQAKQSITALSDKVIAVGHVVNELASHTEAIGAVLDVIRGVSEQTNLLALNAAIEAARAGEHGRGFAVVADEVRTLAQRTNDSTEEIQATINRLQQEAERAVTAMSDSEQQANEGVTAVTETESSLHQIMDNISTMRDINNLVATATEQQSVVAGEITENVHQIQDQTNETLDASEGMAKASMQLQELAESLDKLVSGYR